MLKFSQIFLGTRKCRKNLLFMFNLKECDAKLKFPNPNDFWSNVFISGCKFSFSIPQNAINIGKQIVWNNSNILIGNRVVERKKGFPATLRIADLMEGRTFRNLLSYQNYHCTRVNWLDYISTLQAIPPYWKTILCDDPMVNDEWYDKLSFALQCKALSRAVYHKLNDDRDGLYSSGRSWHKRLTNFEWHVHDKAFSNLYKITNITQLRNFQYRLLHNKIYCNNVLYHWKISPTQGCDFCDSNKQDITHLLFYCPMAQAIWAKLENVFLTQYEDTKNILKFNLENIIYNLVHPKPGHVVNFIL